MAKPRRPSKKTPRSKKPRGLTYQQRLFAHEYLVDRNGTQAAIRAGYSERSAHSIAHDLLKKPEIQAIIAAGMRRLEEKTELSLEVVVTELGRILLADPLDAYNEDGTIKPLPEWPKPLRRALSGFEQEERLEFGPDDTPIEVVLKKVRMWSKTEAGKLLGRHFNMFEKENKDVAQSLGNLIRASLGEGEQ